MFASGVQPAGKGTMKIKIELTVDINPEEYANEYMVAQSEIRQDIKDSVRNYVETHFAAMLNNGVVVK
jgi:hypothetical protein